VRQEPAEFVSSDYFDCHCYIWMSNLCWWGGKYTWGFCFSSLN